MSKILISKKGRRFLIFIAVLSFLFFGFLSDNQAVYFAASLCLACTFLIDFHDEAKPEARLVISVAILLLGITAMALLIPFFLSHYGPQDFEFKFGPALIGFGALMAIEGGLLFGFFAYRAIKSKEEESSPR